MNFVSRTAAVEVKDARLSYGRGSKRFQALNGVNLSVPEGVIYGLLGPSGCGKTSLLCTVVGQRTLKHGIVKVFGKTPGSSDSSVPGRGVGYMPQELALYPEFTIEETLTYFGRLHRMDSKTLEERTDFLLKFLDLPKEKRLVKNLSGGQQRRVSFAVALIHSPPLLILDEPTVGVDPLLRQSIWNYLVKLTTTEGMTVLITTHYIEEARQANVVGLMRQGRLLAETSPDALIRKFNLPTLEDCFLQLCMADTETQEWNGFQYPSVLDVNSDVFKSMALFEEKSPATTDGLSTNISTTHSASNFKRYFSTDCSCDQDNTKKFRANSFADSINKTFAITAKNMTRLRRNLAVVLFQFALPTIQVILLCLVIGHPPFDLPLAVVNHDGPIGMGRLYLQKLDNFTIKQKVFDNTDSAFRSAREGSTWGVLVIGERFSENLLKRFSMGLDADNETIDASTIKVYLDMTNQQIALTLQSSLLESFQEFAKQMLTRAEASTALSQLPVVFQTPIYGPTKPKFTEFIVPGVILSITYIMAVGLTALSFVEERKSGLLERSWVSGVTSTQILVSHMITQSAVLVVQVFGVLVFIFLVFDIPSRGPFILIILMTLLQGATGMSYGLLISSLVTQESTAIMVALGSFYPNLILSGIIWPTQGMAPVIRVFSYCLPQTLPTQTMRAVLGRGWGITYSAVWSGFLVSSAWLLVFLIAAGAVFRLRK